MPAPTELARRHLHSAANAVSWLYLLTVFWLVAWVVLARLLLGWTPVVITGESMAPRIRAGDVVLVDRHARTTALGAGTVVTVDDPVAPGGLLTHRVVRLVPGGYELRGDANARPDSTLVRATDVRGIGRLLVPRSRGRSRGAAGATCPPPSPACWARSPPAVSLSVEHARHERPPLRSTNSQVPRRGVGAARRARR